MPADNQERLTADVAAYLADCRRHRVLLSPAYHPTAAGALKVVYHQGAEEARFIRAEFARLNHATREEAD